MKLLKREYTTSISQLDIRVLQRHGLLLSGRTAVLRWDATTTANIITVGSVVRVNLQLEHVSVKDEISITHTDTGMGQRGWWSCPCCGRRCAVLFLQERLACRQCSRLHYATQSAGVRRRALLKANKLRALYGADPELPMRPRWMRQAKFEQKMREAEAAVAVVFPWAANRRNGADGAVEDRDVNNDRM